MSELPDTYGAESLQHERQKDDHELATFVDYRTMCDRVDNIRLVGIQDEKSYLKAILDPRTTFTDFEGKRVPLFAPIEYEKMYDLKSCIELTSKPNVMLLSLPLELIEKEGGIGSVALDHDTAVIIEEFVQVNDVSILPSEHEAPFFINNPSVRIMDFKHPDLASMPSNENAWMAAYSFEFGPNKDSATPFKQQDFKPHVAEVWKEYCEANNQAETPHEGAEGTFFLFAEQLAQMPEVVDKMWSISEIGFGKILGAHHPVSMEFNREFFNQQTSASNTVTAIHYVDGQPVCFGFIGLDMSNNDWINTNSTVMKNELHEAEEAQRAYVHFHELISNGVEGMGYSTNILKTFLDIAARTHYDYSVFFESTNLSSTYIPAIVEKEISKVEGLLVKRDIKMLGKLTYWAVIEDD
jgi:hypothetical protein